METLTGQLDYYFLYKCSIYQTSYIKVSGSLAQILYAV
jgi:hypothetical protein